MTPGGRVPEGTLGRKLQGHSVHAFLLGTELPAAPYATYSVRAGADALAALDEAQFHSAQPTAHVKTLSFPPSELTLMHLHRFLAREFPDAYCARWPHWRLDTPVSPVLAECDSCGMGLRCLQHFLDMQHCGV